MPHGGEGGALETAFDWSRRSPGYFLSHFLVGQEAGSEQEVGPDHKTSRPPIATHFLRDTPLLYFYFTCIVVLSICMSV